MPSNNALERTVRHGGPRLAAAPASWPAAQLGRLRAFRSAVQKSNEVRDQLRAVERILREWDPIGVLTSESSLPDEYDSYAPLVLKQLQNGADVEAVANHLTNLTTSEMSIEPNAEHDREIAGKLIAWWNAQRSTGNAV
jgi:hypothetical protein